MIGRAFGLDSSNSDATGCRHGWKEASRVDRGGCNAPGTSGAGYGAWPSAMPALSSESRLGEQPGLGAVSDTHTAAWQ